MKPRNFRDAGEWVNAISGQRLLCERVLYRGGKFEEGTERSDLGGARTIVNLRMHPDPPVEGAVIVQAAATNDLEKYDTANRHVRAWLNQAVAVLAGAYEAPFYVHCASGKDRTGLVVAVALLAVGVPREALAEEYALSEGELDVPLFRRALEGVGDPVRYLDRVDQAGLRRRLLASAPPKQGPT
jgi:protein-tyrosine phosphatase